MNEITEVLSQPPSTGPLFAKAALKRGRHSVSPALPQRRLSLSLRPVTAKLAHYHQLVNWQGTGVHPCWLQVRALPMQLTLLTETDFPFAVMGLIHMQNRISQYQAINENMALTLTCYMDGLKKHRLGWQFQMITKAYHQQHLVWQSVATTLAPTVRLSGAGRKTCKGAGPEGEPVEHWHLESDLGWRYAKVSGDYNPIHIHSLTARLFGFRQPIIHGMWSYARGVSALAHHQSLSQPFTSSVTFKRPLTLPGDAELYLDAASPEQGRFELRGTDEQKVLLCGDWQPLKADP